MREDIQPLAAVAVDVAVDVMLAMVSPEGIIPLIVEPDELSREPDEVRSLPWSISSWDSAEGRNASADATRNELYANSRRSTRSSTTDISFFRRLEACSNFSLAYAAQTWRLHTYHFDINLKKKIQDCNRYLEIFCLKLSQLVLFLKNSSV